jgi:hypothetical protein
MRYMPWHGAAADSTKASAQLAICTNSRHEQDSPYYAVSALLVTQRARLNHSVPEPRQMHT